MKNDIKEALNNLMGEEEEEKKKEGGKIYSNLRCKMVSIRLPVDDVERLQKYFRKRGIINFSEGMRRVLFEFLEKNKN